MRFHGNKLEAGKAWFTLLNMGENPAQISPRKFCMNRGAQTMDESAVHMAQEGRRFFAPFPLLSAHPQRIGG